MSMYDRDWYREEYNKRESLNRTNRRNVPSNSGKIGSSDIGDHGTYDCIQEN